MPESLKPAVDVFRALRAIPRKQLEERIVDLEDELALCRTVLAIQEVTDRREARDKFVPATDMDGDEDDDAAPEPPVDTDRMLANFTSGERAIWVRDQAAHCLADGPMKGRRLAKKFGLKLHVLVACLRNDTQRFFCDRTTGLWHLREAAAGSLFIAQ